MIPLQRMSSRQKDKFIENVLRMSENVDGNEGFARTASSPISSAIMDKAESQLNNTLNGLNGLKRVAFAMQVPLKSRLDYVAVGRNRLLLVDEMPQGDFPTYDLDIPEFGAVTVAARGTAPIFQANIKRITFPTFPIAINHTIKYEEIQIRRYPAFDRAKERSAIAVAITEDDQIIGVVKKASEVGVNPIQHTLATQLTRTQLADAFGTIYTNQLVVGTVLMHPKRYADVLKFGTGGSTDFDQVSVNTIIETGLFGVIYGARLLVTTRVPVGANDTAGMTGTAGSVYVCTTPDKLGRLPERKAVEVKIFDDIMQQQYAIMSWEQVGMGVFNTGGVVKMDYTNS